MIQCTTCYDVFLGEIFFLSLQQKMEELGCSELSL